MLSLGAAIVGWSISLPDSRALAAPNPMTLPEIITMLHVGLSSEDVEREVAARHVLGPVDAASEAALKSAQATPHLIALLKSGGAQLSQTEAEAARSRMAAAAAANVVPTAPATSASVPSGPSQMAALLRGGKLVTCKGGQLANYDETQLEAKKYFAFYYSAHWCGPCKRFTPELVEFYHQMTQDHPEVEVVFISRDHSAADMGNYMRETGMPWPALRYERTGSEHELTKYAGGGIPDLVLTDRDGRVLSDSFHGEEYVGPQRVLKDLARLLDSRGNRTALNERG